MTPCRGEIVKSLALKKALASLYDQLFVAYLNDFELTPYVASLGSLCTSCLPTASTLPSRQLPSALSTTQKLQAYSLEKR